MAPSDDDDDDGDDDDGPANAIEADCAALRGRAKAEWPVIVDMLGEEDGDGKPPRRARKVNEGPN